MTTRLHYALPIVREFLRLRARRLRPGGLAATLPDTAQDRPFIIVTGPGRSGTSAVARVLHESGIRMGTNFDPPSEFNATGFYEETGMRDLNGRMLMESGIGRLNRLPWRATVLAIAANYKEELRAFVATATDGWKDPQFGVALEAWLPYLRQRPKLVVCLRSPESLARSLTPAVGLTPQGLIQRRWSDEFRRLLDVIEDYALEATCIEYDELVQHPQETVAALSTFVGHPLDAHYVAPSLRHQAYEVPREFAALYDRVRSLGPTGAMRTPKSARSNSSSLLDRLRGRVRLTDEELRAVHAYAEKMQAFEARSGAAKDAWSERAGSPPTLAGDKAVGAERIRVAGETNSAAAAYIGVLREVEVGLGSLLPPEQFERYHGSLARWVDTERLVTKLMFQATESNQLDEARLSDAVNAWFRFSSPTTATTAQKQRTHEYERAFRRVRSRA